MNVRTFIAMYKAYHATYLLPMYLLHACCVLPSCYYCLPVSCVMVFIGHECETYNNPADFFLDVIYQYEESCQQAGGGRGKGPRLAVPSPSQEGDLEAVEGNC